MKVKNFLQIDERLASSGQPKPKQFKIIANQGYAYVINLAMPDSINAVSNEGKLVTKQGMQYIHIPVNWDAPNIEQFEFFRSVLNLLKQQKVWVHCALNMRVSSFIYLYKVIEENEDRESAWARMETIWKPNAVWQSFIDNVIRMSES